MKKWTLLLLILSACNGRNELMTKLVNERKMLLDSQAYYKQSEDDRQARALNIDIAGADSNQWKLIIDSAKSDYINRSRIDVRIPQLNFSIDSLSKLK